MLHTVTNVCETGKYKLWEVGFWLTNFEGGNHPKMCLMFGDKLWVSFSIDSMSSWL